MAKAVSGDFTSRAALLTLVEHLDHELAAQRAERPDLRPVGAFEQGRRQALDRVVADGTFVTKGFHGSVEPDLRERVGSGSPRGDGARAVAVGDLTPDHCPGLLLRRLHLAGEVEAELCIALVDADGPSFKGVTYVPPAGRPASSQHQQHGQSHPGCSDPPSDAPTR